MPYINKTSYSLHNRYCLIQWANANGSYKSELFVKPTFLEQSKMLLNDIDGGDVNNCTKWFMTAPLLSDISDASEKEMSGAFFKWLFQPSSVVIYQHQKKT